MAGAMARDITREFGLIGLNGIDFIARKGIPYVVEVNPRYSASMELLERLHGISMFQIHLQACEGKLPGELGSRPGIEGKAVVFARRGLLLGNTDAWLGDPRFADVPFTGERIPTGRPVCTIFARGSDSATCLRKLAAQAGTVYRLTSARTRRAA
jgi:predicted ATP-grasp superfamily ATP-dependent carboligase